MLVSLIFARAWTNVIIPEDMTMNASNSQLRGKSHVLVGSVMNQDWNLYSNLNTLKEVI